MLEFVTMTEATESTQTHQEEVSHERKDENVLKMAKEQSCAEYVVLDSGAIINGQAYSLSKYGKSICTVEEVIKEIRDSKSRHLLEVLPYQLEVMSPSNEAMKSVVEFSKKSGDYYALSLTDLKVIALVYTLECRVNGPEKLLNKIAVNFFSYNFASVSHLFS